MWSPSFKKGVLSTLNQRSALRGKASFLRAPALLLVGLVYTLACDRGSFSKGPGHKFAANTPLSQTSSGNATANPIDSEQGTLQAIAELSQGQVLLAEEQQKLKDAVDKLGERVGRLELALDAVKLELANLVQRVSQLEAVVGIGPAPRVDNLLARMNAAEGSINELAATTAKLEKILGVITGLDSTKALEPAAVAAQLKELFGQDFTSLADSLKKISDMQPQSLGDLQNFIAQYNAAILALKTRKVDESCSEAHAGKCETFVDLLGRSPDAFDKFALSAVTLKISLLVSEMQPVAVRYRAEFEKTLRQLTARGVLKGAKNSPSPEEAAIYTAFQDTERDITAFKESMLALAQGIAGRLDGLAKAVEEERAYVKFELAKHEQILKANDKEIERIKTSLTLSMADMEYQLSDSLYKALSFGAASKADALRLTLNFTNAARRVKALEYYDKKQTGLLDAMGREDFLAAINTWRQQTPGQGTPDDLESHLVRLFSQSDKCVLTSSKAVNKTSFNADVKNWLNQHNDAGNKGSVDPQFAKKFCHNPDNLDYFAILGVEEGLDYIRADVALELAAQVKLDSQVNPVLSGLVEIKAKALIEHHSLKEQVVAWARTNKKSAAEKQTMLADVERCSAEMTDWAKGWLDRESIDTADLQRLKSSFMSRLKAEGMRERWQTLTTRLAECQSCALSADERLVLGGGQAGDAARSRQLLEEAKAKVSSFVAEYAAARQQMLVAQQAIVAELEAIKKVIPAGARAGEKGPVLSDLFASYQASCVKKMQEFENYLPSRLDTLTDVVEGLGEELIAFLDRNGGDVDAKARIESLLAKLAPAADVEKMSNKKKPGITGLLHWYSEETLTQAANNPYYKGQNPAACTTQRHDVGEGAYSLLSADHCSVNFRNIPKELDRDRHILKTTMRVIGACDYLVVRSRCYTAIHPCQNGKGVTAAMQPQMEQIANALLNKTAPQGTDKALPAAFANLPDLVREQRCNYADLADLKRQMLNPKGTMAVAEGAVQNMYDLTENAHLWYGVSTGSDLTHAGYDSSLINVEMQYLPVNIDLGTIPKGPPVILPDSTDPKSCTCKHEVTLVSPLVLDFSGQGLTTLSQRRGVAFDINANGVPDRMGWVSGSEGAFLALDRNGNGKIDNGHELFGSTTQRPNGETAKHGYEALADFDQNNDGLITPADPIFSQLRLWFDDNADGESQAYELQSLEARGVMAIATAIDEAYKAQPNNGNLLRYQARFYGPQFCPVEGCLSYDVYFDTAVDMVGNTAP